MTKYNYIHYQQILHCIFNLQIQMALIKNFSIAWFIWLP